MGDAVEKRDQIADKQEQKYSYSVAMLKAGKEKSFVPSSKKHTSNMRRMNRPMKKPT